MKELLLGVNDNEYERKSSSRSTANNEPKKNCMAEKRFLQSPIKKKQKYCVSLNFKRKDDFTTMKLNRKKLGREIERKKEKEEIVYWVTLKFGLVKFF